MGTRLSWGRRVRINGETGRTAMPAEGGFTLIEVILFFGVTGALLVGILTSASVGVNTQRYSDAVNTFAAVVQQEFTNASNVVNSKSVGSLCGVAPGEIERGLSDCVILGRLVTIDGDGKMELANIVGREPSTPPSDSLTELQLISTYAPKIDNDSRETGQMNWGTKVLQSGNPSFVTLLIVRSPRTGGMYSYVIHSNSAVATSADGAIASVTAGQNSRDQYMCVDRAGWVMTPMRAIKIAPYASGPSAVSVMDAGTVCG